MRSPYFTALVDVAVCQRRDEDAVKEIGVLRIGPQRRAIERGGGGGVAIDAGVTCGQVAARRGQFEQIAAGGIGRGFRGFAFGSVVVRRLCKRRRCEGSGYRRGKEGSDRHAAGMD